MDKLPPIELKPLRWVGASLKELKAFPRPVVRAMGHALLEAQAGGKAESARPLQGFGGAGILEIVEDHRGDTYRAVYTVKLGDTVFVLHCFQKKSKTGVGTPKQTIDLIKQRLRFVEDQVQRGSPKP